MAEATEDLTRRDWLEAGQRMLRTEGLRALRLRALAQSLDISTGSFYHHFKDFDAYLGELAAYYAGEQLTRNLAEIRAQAPTAHERLMATSRFAASHDLTRLMLAMRAWARSDARALAAVQALDAALMAFFAEALEEMGHSPRDAAARAVLMIAAANLEAEPLGAPDRAEFRERVRSIIVGRTR